MQIWAESGKSALPICNYSQILYQFLTFTQNLKRSPAFFLLPSFGRFNHIFYLTFNSMIKTKCCRNLLIAFFFSKKTG